MRTHNLAPHYADSCLSGSGRASVGRLSSAAAAHHSHCRRSTAALLTSNGAASTRSLGTTLAACSHRASLFRPLALWQVITAVPRIAQARPSLAPQSLRSAIDLHRCTHHRYTSSKAVPIARPLLRPGNAPLLYSVWHMSLAPHLPMLDHLCLL
jgi:hypothetical protein